MWMVLPRRGTALSRQPPETAGNCLDLVFGFFHALSDSVEHLANAIS
jgi:hypothetical protein